MPTPTMTTMKITTTTHNDDNANKDNDANNNNGTNNNNGADNSNVPTMPENHHQDSTPNCSWGGNEVQ
jgi:hypothetical protein